VADCDSGAIHREPNTFFLAPGSGTPQVNFNGGTLLALSNSTTISGFSGTELNIQAGGLTINTTCRSYRRRARQRAESARREAATGAERAAFQLTNEFLTLMLDPFVTGRTGGFGGGGTIGFAPEQQVNLPPDVARAYAAILPKAPPPSPTFDQRWTVWGGGYGGSSGSAPPVGNSGRG
jgi:hypothetical protein